MICKLFTQGHLEIAMSLIAGFTKGCSLLACNLPKKNSITQIFGDIFQYFQTPLSNLIRSSILVTLQSVNFWILQENQFSEHTNALDRVFDIVIECRNFSYHFIRKCFYGRPFLINFENPRKNSQEAFSVRLDNSNCLKETLLQTFLHEVSETFKTPVFPKVPGKFTKCFFSETYRFCYLNEMASFQTFSWQISDYFKILKFSKFQNNFSFLSTSRKIYVMGLLVREQSVEFSRAILLKGNSTSYTFLDIFQSFRCSYLKTP